MSEPNETPWSAEQVYDEQIAPLMKQIVAICKEHQIPMVAKFQYAHDAENGPAFCTTALPLDRACENIRDLARRIGPKPPQHFAIAETHITHPDGHKEIRIQRVG